MSVIVLVEQLTQGYRVRSGEPLALSVEGPSREEALQRFQSLWREKLQQGTALLTLPLSSGPSLGFAPVWPDDEVTQCWQQGIREYRQQCDAEPEPWEQTEESAS